jgi:hypothetical protein
MDIGELLVNKSVIKYKNHKLQKQQLISKLFKKYLSNHNLILVI